MISFVVRWCSTAELTPLRYVRPSYRFLRPRSRENLSPAGTSHFPRPWVGHVLRTDHLTDDMAMKTFNLGKRCKKTSFFTPFQKI